MLNKLVEELSDISRTNQLKITDNLQTVAEKLFQYLFKNNQGIEFFCLSPETFENSEYEERGKDFYRRQHKSIKKQIQERLFGLGKKVDYADIQYFLSYADDKKYVFYLSPNKNHSGWQQLFDSNRERVFNLIFKSYLLSQNLSAESIDTVNGFEELLLLHSRSLTKTNALVVWGQNLLINYNQHNVLTLILSRKSRKFLPKDSYKSLDGDDIGELVIYNRKKYYFERDFDARHRNKIDFMNFKNDKFKKTQIYYYQNLMTKLEKFLKECDINFEALDFQCNYYLEKTYIKDVKSIESLEIINNTGIDLTNNEQQFLKNFLEHQDISDVTFYNSGKTVSTYEKIEAENEDKPGWKINEVLSWSGVKLERTKNYLVFNKCLGEETGSMAYQKDEGIWYSSTDIKDKEKVDFYSQLKRKFNYVETGDFYSTQGINVPEFKAVGEEKSSWAILQYKANKIDVNTLRLCNQAFTNESILDLEELIFSYIKEQKDADQWKVFWKQYKSKINILPEFQKVLIELKIKNWIRQNLLDSNHSDFGISISAQSFAEKRFFTIYVRSPRHEKAKAVAVEFLYKDEEIYIINVMRDIEQIKREFKFLRKRKRSEELINDQQYFVDESEKVYISCYTSDHFTPTLIGRNGILEGLEKEQLEINRKVKGEDSSKLLPLISYYSSEIKPANRIQSMICLDLQNETFIQYYVPPGKNINQSIKRGFRVYHLIGRTYDEEIISTSELIEHPITAIHFNTITQNVLKLSDNSQSSLLQKVAKILIEN